MGTGRQYDNEFKVQAVKLSYEIGQNRAAEELGVPNSTIATWCRAVNMGTLDIGEEGKTPKRARTLAEEVNALRKQVRDQEKEIGRLKKENDFLEEASAFFAASRRKSERRNG